MLDIVPVQTYEQIDICQQLAFEIWQDYYVPIIGQKQVDYMLLHFQSRQAIKHQMEEGTNYFLALHNGESIGYFSLHPDEKEKELKLSKIYLKSKERGQGFGRGILEFIEDFARQRGMLRIFLTVNKNNTGAINFYKRNGFQNTGPIVQDIGGGFVMDDFKMVKAF